MCLSLQGKRNSISKKDFLGLSEHLGLNSKQVHIALERLSGLGSVIELMVAESLLEERLRNKFLEIFKERMKRLFK